MARSSMSSVPSGTRSQPQAPRSRKTPAVGATHRQAVTATRQRRPRQERTRTAHTDPRASHLRPSGPGEPDGRPGDMHDSDEARIGALMTRFLHSVSFEAGDQPRYGE